MKSSPTRKSRGVEKTTQKHPKEKPYNDQNPARAHRGDTPEAKAQEARRPKSHPGKATAPRNAMRRHKAKG
jgi:hypothetical protein